MNPSTPSRKEVSFMTFDHEGIEGMEAMAKRP